MGCLIPKPEGVKVERAMRLNLKASNNEAEYEAVIYAPKSVLVMGATKVDLFTDSKMLANQFSGSY